MYYNEGIFLNKQNTYTTDSMYRAYELKNGQLIKIQDLGVYGYYDGLFYCMIPYIDSDNIYSLTYVKSDIKLTPEEFNKEVKDRYDTINI
jgi:hypothetical protein